MPSSLLFPVYLLIHLFSLQSQHLSLPPLVNGKDRELEASEVQQLQSAKDSEVCEGTLFIISGSASLTGSVSLQQKKRLNHLNVALSTDRPWWIIHAAGSDRRHRCYIKQNRELSHTHKRRINPYFKKNVSGPFSGSERISIILEDSIVGVFGEQLRDVRGLSKPINLPLLFSPCTDE